MQTGRWAGSEVLEVRQLLTSFLVTTLEDTVDPADGVTSLREAIEAANSSSESDSISFASGLFSSGTAVINLQLGELPFTDTVGSTSIPGPGRDVLQIKGNGSRIFRVDAEVNVSIDGLTLKEGTSAAGGAIFNEGILAISNAWLTGNSAVGDSGAAGRNGSGSSTGTGGTGGTGGAGGQGNGGAIYNSGTLSISNSMLTDNFALGGRGGDGGDGGRGGRQFIQGRRGGTGGTGGVGGTAKGGAIFNTAAGSISVNDVIFVGNEAEGGRGGFGGEGGEGGGGFTISLPGSGGNGGTGGNGGNAEGGAIYSEGMLTISETLMLGSLAEAGSVGGGGFGGSGGAGSNSFGSNGVSGSGGGTGDASDSTIVDSTGTASISRTGDDPCPLDSFNDPIDVAGCNTQFRIESVAPTDGEQLPADRQLALNFPRNAVVGNGMIRFRQSADDSVAAEVDVRNVATVTGNVAQIAVPTLAAGLYTLEIPASAFADESGQDSLGINDQTPWLVPQFLVGSIRYSVERVGEEVSTDAALTFRVSFTDQVSNVDALDFQPVTSNTIVFTSMSVSDGDDSDDSTWFVTVEGVSGFGTLGLSLGTQNNVTDAAGNVVDLQPVSTQSFSVPFWNLISEIDGTSSLDESGESVAINNDGTVLVIGAPASDTAGSSSGQVRVLEREAGSGNWELKGSILNGMNSADFAGRSVAVNGTGNIIAFGATGGDATASSSGETLVYQFDDATSDWIQLGNVIGGEAASDGSGSSIALSDDGLTIAIGAPGNDGGGSGSGHARVLRYSVNTAQWEQLGQDIDGVAAGDAASAVDLSADGQTLAVGSRLNDSNGLSSGHTRVFRFDSTAAQWIQLGSDISGETAGDQSGTAVSLSSDGNTLAVGEPTNDESSANAGRVRVFRFSLNTNSWQQLGNNIPGEDSSSFSGESVSLTGDGAFLAVGANENSSGTGVDAGHVRTFAYDANQNVWNQVGRDLDGESVFDMSGTSVSLSADGRTLAVGAPDNDGNGNRSGHVRIFADQPVVPLLTMAISANEFRESAGDTAATGVVTREGDLSNSLTVTLNSSDTTEANVPVTITIEAGQASSAAFEIAAVDDLLADGRQNVVIEASAAGFRPATTSITIADDDVATFTIDDLTINEAAGTASLVVSLDVAVDIDLMIDVQYMDGTGASTDFDGTTDTVTFIAGSTVAQTVTISITDDNVVEQIETFTASMSINSTTSPGDRTVVVSDTAAVSIIDDDTATFTIDDVLINEADGTANFTVWLDKKLDTDVSIDVVYSTDSAGDSDFDGTTDTITFPAGSTTPQTVSVAIVKDSIVEATEIFLVSLAIDASTSLGSRNVDVSDTAIGIITDSAAADTSGDADGDGDFDANDSFLMHLLKLAGTDSQVNLSKGSSSLTASQIRSFVDELAVTADVDGDQDFDANDSFLIHLVQLSGNDAQINQSKGSSLLTATQIRANVDALGNSNGAASSATQPPAPRRAVYADLSAAAQELFASDATTSRVAGETQLPTAADDSARDTIWTEFRSWIDVL